MAIGFPTKANWAAGDVLTASAMDDLAGTVNLVSAPLYNAAGKNKIINGDYNVSQRGTSFNAAYFNGGNTYSLDRWNILWDNVPTSVTVSQQAFTLGAAPVAGYEGTSFYRSLITTVGSCTIWQTRQKIEDVRVYAGQTATVSFWAKADTTRNVTVGVDQVFGSGGSATVSAISTTSATLALTTSWVRYSVTFTVASISGKTIGTGSSLTLSFVQAVASGSTLDLWGVQLEAGSYATGFQTATGTLQGELAACQRYYYRVSAAATNSNLSASGVIFSSTASNGLIPFPVQMRTFPTSVDYAALRFSDVANIQTAISVVTISNGCTPYMGTLDVTSSGMTTGRFGYIQSSSISGYIGFSAEL